MRPRHVACVGFSDYMYTVLDYRLRLSERDASRDTDDARRAAGERTVNDTGFTRSTYIVSRKQPMFTRPILQVACRMH